MLEPTILHVDLDAFFVAMELLRHPELRGRPVIVGYPGPRGVVSTASYEARRYGVRSAMPMARARQLCPAAVILPPDFSRYAPASRHFHAILRDITPVVEPAGADEAYLDVAGSTRLLGTPLEIGQRIRQRIREDLGITASVGIAANRIVAKVASDAAKPDGLLLVPPGEEAAFLAPRPIRDLPMVGQKTARSLAGLGVRTIGELAALPERLLVSRFGRFGAELRARALGASAAPVVATAPARRSVSREHTFETDISDPAALRAILFRQAEHLAAELARQGRAARTVTLKIRFPPFETHTRSHSPSHALLYAPEIVAVAFELFEDAWEAHHRRPVRLIGLGATGLHERARQLALGETTESDTLNETLIRLRERFGPAVVRRAAELLPGVDTAQQPAKELPRFGEL